MPSQHSTQPELEPAIFEGPLHPRLRLHSQFKSRFLPDARDLTVYLPPGYEENPDRHYPVMLLHDGQNLFDPNTAFIPGRTWKVAEAADEAISCRMVEPLIIVGVANTGERRLAEYTPDADWKLGGGEAARYGELLVKDLLPFIASQYRIRTGAENTGLGGSSLGGLVSLYLGLKYPEVFARLAVLSPSVWWNHRSIIGYVNETAPALPEKPRIWLDVGEGEGRRTVLDADLLDRRLVSNGWKPGENLSYLRVPGGMHDETSWAARVAPMLGFLFPAK
ncbi:alpha/beta hydrolase [Silvibacterium acidisoli]|uniref:alpha/beta hydrolase n=1 Tax=Acidobacteriaceae bacterium ZG23-2 TaxID=2883246 RepID=UPI00406CD7D0